MPPTIIKRILGHVPLAADIYERFHQHDDANHDKQHRRKFSLDRVEKGLPEWISHATAARENAITKPDFRPRRLLFYSSQRYWIEYSMLLGVTMAGQGHEVDLAYVPYPNWRRDINRFDQDRLAIYARNVMQQAEPLVHGTSLLDVNSSKQSLPAELKEAIREVSVRDVQYTLQVEEIDQNEKLFRLRRERNTQAAQAAFALIEAQQPNVLITPNGSILEMGAVYQVAQFLNLPVVTYEFGEQRGRIWLARNDEVMRQDTSDLWRAYKTAPLSEEQLASIRALYDSRQRASLWQNFARLWQGQPVQGGEKVRQALGLDRRPIALLPANVIGDSLTLGRQIFSKSMTDWLQGTVRYFAQRPDVQLVVRIHPGERYLKGGPSVADVVRDVLRGIDKDAATSHIHLVAANEAINTYDLVETADLGLVYTTTVGMEMAMSGVPVVVAGQTHYRSKGFTIDPDTWEAYTDQLDKALANPKAFRLDREQIEQAWSYAYRYFFDYPVPFPWHLLDFWKELKTWSIERVLSAEGQEKYGEAFQYLTGKPRDFSKISSEGSR